MRKPREIAVLMEVAAWREREAQERDVPRNRVLKDEAVIDVAVSAPRSSRPRTAALHPERLRAIPGRRGHSGGGRTGLARDPATLPANGRARSRGGGALVELLKVLLGRCRERAGRPKVIASVDRSRGDRRQR
jgi:ribonuclease D